VTAKATGDVRSSSDDEVVFLLFEDEQIARSQVESLPQSSG